MAAAQICFFVFGSSICINLKHDRPDHLETLSESEGRNPRKGFRSEERAHPAFEFHSKHAIHSTCRWDKHIRHFLEELLVVVPSKAHDDASTPDPASNQRDDIGVGPPRFSM
jgi:hypothetical protein